MNQKQSSCQSFYLDSKSEISTQEKDKKGKEKGEIFRKVKGNFFRPNVDLRDLIERFCGKLESNEKH